MFGRKSRKKKLVGLDIGQTSVKAVELFLKSGAAHLNALGRESLKEDTIIDGQIIDPGDVAGAMAKLFRSAGIEPGGVNTGVGGYSVITKNILLPSMTDEELDESIDWHAEEHIPFDIADVYLGYQKTSSEPDSITVLMACCKKELIEGRRQVIEAAGGRLAAVEVSSLALQNCYLFNYGHDEKACVVLIDVGASSTIINILSGGRSVFARDVSLGGSHYTQLLQRELGMTFEQAEAAKLGRMPEVEIEGVGVDAAVEAVARARAVETDFENLTQEVNDLLLLEIQKTFDFFRAVYDDDEGEVRKIYISGGASRTKGLKERLEERFEVAVERLDPFRAIKYDDRKFSAEQLSAMGPEMAVAVGLALKGVDAVHVSVNLLGIDEKEKAKPAKTPAPRKEQSKWGVYLYVGRNRLNERVEGERVADGPEPLRLLLKREQITLTSATWVNPKTSNRSSERGRERVTLEEMELFTRRFSTFIDAGLPLVQSLDILGEEWKNQYFRRVIREVMDSVEKGDTLSASMARHPKAFDNLYVAMTEAGECGGILDISFNRIADYLGRRAKVRRDVKQALLLPLTALAFASVVLAALIVFALRSGPGAQAGARGFLGRALASVGAFLGGMGGLIVLAALIAAVVGAVFYYRARRSDVNSSLQKVPVLGPILYERAIARFARVLSTLLSSGVPIIQSLDITEENMGDTEFREAVSRIRSGVERGESFTEPMRGSGLFPTEVTHMVGIGEQTGALDSMLSKIASFYEEKVDERVAALPLKLAPVILILFVVLAALVLLYV